MSLVKRNVNIEDHLGIETGPLDAEQISLSGNHNDVQDGTFQLQFNKTQGGAMQSPWEQLELLEII